MNDPNPYAPGCYNGFNDTSPPGWRDEDYTYSLDLLITTPNQQTVTLIIQKDADFVWCGLVILSTSPFNVRFTDGEGYFIPNMLVNSSMFPGDGASPFPMSPGEILYPAGSPMHIDIQCPSVATLGTCGIEFQFRGKKRKSLQAVAA